MAGRSFAGEGSKDGIPLSLVEGVMWGGWRGRGLLHHAAGQFQFGPGCGRKKTSVVPSRIGWEGLSLEHPGVVAWENTILQKQTATPCEGVYKDRGAGLSTTTVSSCMFFVVWPEATTKRKHSSLPHCPLVVTEPACFFTAKYCFAASASGIQMASLRCQKVKDWEALEQVSTKKHLWREFH